MQSAKKREVSLRWPQVRSYLRLVSRPMVPEYDDDHSRERNKAYYR